MTSANQKGFTIIEVILFLALSSLFLAIAFTGIRGKTANVQFTDAMRSLQAFLVSEENKILNGVNSTPNSPSDCPSASGITGESNNCILIGRVVAFGKNNADSEVGVRVLYGKKLLPQDLASKSDYELIKDSKPRPDEVIENYGISWGVTFNPAKSVNLDINDGLFDRIGWLRSPGSTRIIPIAFKSEVDDTNLENDNLYKKSSGQTRLGDQVETRLCFSGDAGRVASITFGDRTGTSSTILEFDDPECK